MISKDRSTDKSQEITTLPRPNLPADVRARLLRPSKQNGRDSAFSALTENPSVKLGQYRSSPMRDSNGHKSSRRYYALADDGGDWPPELNDYNQRFAKTLEGIKRRHDGVVTTIGELAL